VEASVVGKGGNQAELVCGIEIELLCEGVVSLCSLRALLPLVRVEVLAEVRLRVFQVVLVDVLVVLVNRSVLSFGSLVRVFLCGLVHEI